MVTWWRATALMFAALCSVIEDAIRARAAVRENCVSRSDSGGCEDWVWFWFGGWDQVSLGDRIFDWGAD